MRLNPYVNALCALAYVWSIGFLMFSVSEVRHDTPDKFFDPILAISVLVFSVAVMGFLFFYYPVVLLIENKKHDAVLFFLKTLITFGVVTFASMILFIF